MSDQNTPNNLESYWMPFTANRKYKADPRMVVSASGMYYKSADGRDILDTTAGLWCVNAGHKHPKIVEAVKAQVDTLDYAPCFQFGHPKPFELANKIVELFPDGMDHVFFTNSGSESVDTALKIALAYHRAKGEGGRTRLIGREKAYHGVGFGGLSVGGMVSNRSQFGPLLPGVDHLPHTHHPEHNAFSRGCPEWGVHLADNLEDLVQLHGAASIAAVIVEPMSGAAGVYIPPKGYLKRLREICDRHGLLLIFDEVITAYGRLGAASAVEYFDVVPDMVCMAKGLTNATIPMGGVVVNSEIYDTVVHNSETPIELFHGYTYSGHPVAAAAGVATLDVYREEELFKRAADMAPYFEDALHSLKDVQHVKDIRNLGLVGAVELVSREGEIGTRAYDVMVEAFQRGVAVRMTGETLAFSPSLIVQKGEVDLMFEVVSDILKALE